MTPEQYIEDRKLHALITREHALLDAALRRAVGELTADELDDYVIAYADAHAALKRFP